MQHMPHHNTKIRTVLGLVALLLSGLLLSACETTPIAPIEAPNIDEKPEYHIGPGDGLRIFVWRNPELSSTVSVRPDGQFSTPLVEDMQAAGKTPTALARDVEKTLAKYVKSPVVTIIMTGFVGPFSDQVRVVGEAAQPQALSYRENMTLLDLMITVGGLTDFADGNKASIIRNIEDEQKQFTVRIKDLIKKGDISANVDIFPGDILIIPEALF